MLELIERFAGALFIVIPLIWLSLYIYSKYATNGRGRDNAKLMRVVSSLPLGPKKTVSVVDIAGKYMVLGIGADSISYITTIDDAQVIEKLTNNTIKRKDGAFMKAFNFKKNLSAMKVTAMAREKFRG